MKNNKLRSSHNIPHEATINETNIGFVKPEHRLLKISTNALTNLLSQGAVEDDSVNISFDMKMN